MRYLFLYITLAFSTANLYSQESFKDTISLQEVKINKKKLKVITSKQGKGKQKIGNGLFTTIPEQAYLIEGLPHGTLQSITLHFMWVTTKIIEGKIPTSNVEATTYELILYEVKGNKLGAALHSTPIIIQLPASKKAHPSIKVDLTTLHITTDRIFAVLKRTSALPCEECNFYIPIDHYAEKQLIYHGDIANLTIAKKTVPAPYPSYYTGLLCEIKTLTREY